MNPDESGNLSFRPRHERQPARRVRRSSTLPWLVVAVVSAVLFVLVVRALLERTAWTAGPSDVPVATDGGESSPLGQADVGTSYVDAPPVPMVYRCVDRAGGVALQSQPCGAGQRMTRAVPAPPDVEPVRPARPPAQSRRLTSNGIAYNGYAGQGQNQHAQQVAACASARRDRDATLARIGLNRTYDLLQRLDANVRESCKGV